MKLLIVLASLLAIFSHFAPPGLAAERPENAAIEAAGDFIDLLNRQEYAAGWEQGSVLLQRQMPLPEWIERLEAIRPLFGAPINRVPIATRFLDRHPGLPDGDYCTIVFECSFEHKAKAIETLLLRRDVDGLWRVVNYIFQ